MIVQAKRIYVLMIRVNEGFNPFSPQCFLKEIENMFKIHVSNTRESLGELEKAVETLAYGLDRSTNIEYCTMLKHCCRNDQVPFS